MAGHPAPSADLRHWWQRHPWAGLCCGWLMIGALVLGASGFWATAALVLAGHA